MTIAPAPLLTPAPWGPGRADASRLIVNRLIRTPATFPRTGLLPRTDQNPLSLECPAGTWTQWGGVATGSDQTKLGRDPGCVHAHGPAIQDTGGRTLRFERCHSKSKRLRTRCGAWRLPKWPEEVLGKIDRRKAPRARRCLPLNCASCHNSYPYTWTQPNKYGKRFLKLGSCRRNYVGTDRQFELFLKDLT